MPGKAQVKYEAALAAPGGDRTRRPAWQGWGLALLTTLSLSTLPPTIKFTITLGIDPTFLLAARYVLATVLLGGTIAIFWPQRLRSPDRVLIHFALVAGLSYAVGVLLFVWSLTRLDASVASMTYSLYPLLALGVLALKGEKFSYRNIVRLALGLSGLYLLLGAGGQVDLLGILRVWGAMIAMLVYLFTIQWRLDGYDPRTVGIYLISVMAVVMVGVWLAQGAVWSVFGWQGWLAISWLAIIGTYLVQMTMVASVRAIGSGQVALLNPLETFLTVVWSVLFLAEQLTPLQWVGGGCILLSALLAIRRLRRAQTVQVCSEHSALSQNL